MYSGIGSLFFRRPSQPGIEIVSRQTLMVEQTAYAEPAIGRPDPQWQVDEHRETRPDSTCEFFADQEYAILLRIQIPNSELADS